MPTWRNSAAGDIQALIYFFLLSRGLSLALLVVPPPPPPPAMGKAGKKKSLVHKFVVTTGVDAEGTAPTLPVEDGGGARANPRCAWKDCMIPYDPSACLQHSCAVCRRPSMVCVVSSEEQLMVVFLYSGAHRNANTTLGEKLLIGWLKCNERIFNIPRCQIQG